MIRWLAVVGRVVWSLVSHVFWSLVSRPAGEVLQDSETEQGPLPSSIIRHKYGEGSEQTRLFWTSSPIQKLNDNIYELYKPNGEPAMEILFFHGLQFGHSGDAYLSTWTTGDGSRKVWPGTWLAEEFPNARIFFVSYDSSMRTTPEQGRSDLFIVAENLMHAILLANIGQGFRRPVVLVGHSFGGLVMKHLCVKADQQHSLDPNSEGNRKIGKFLRNMGGLFFYGTPHREINLPPLAAHFLDSPLLDYMKLHFLDSPLLDYMKLLSAEGARLETTFDAVCKKYEIWHIRSIGEAHETSWGLLHLQVVPEGSARYSTDFCTVPADHLSICKPASQTSSSFQLLINFITKVEGGGRFDNYRLLCKATVGLDVGVDAVCKMLQKGARVGIHGMGGVGKTTLAKAVFDKLGPIFEYTCFCPDVKLLKESRQNVEKEIWKHMYWDGKKVAKKDYDWHKLRGKLLLLILDDVAHDIDLEVLPQIASTVNAESRFIFTSRGKEILKDADCIKLYEVPFLSEKDAKSLFLSYAFPNQAAPPLALETQIDVVVMKCEGLPLTLEVLGKYLNGQQDGAVWKQTIEVLHNAESVSNHDDRIWEKLRLSYTGLPEKEQQMFLDAATFFSSNRWTLHDAKTVWRVRYGCELFLWQSLWQSLVDASLVYDVEDDNPIKVHEQLRSLGRKIAFDNADKDGRRVWNGPMDRLESDVQTLRLRLRSGHDDSNDSPDWYDDPLTFEMMCDPVKCNDGFTYDRWTIIDNVSAMHRSPYNRNLALDIMCDDFSVRSRLFQNFPNQEAKFHDRRNNYRDIALQNAHALKFQAVNSRFKKEKNEEFEVAKKMLENVLKWAPLDTECRNELNRIQNVESAEIQSPTASIPVLNHHDLVRERGSEGRRTVLFFILLYICIMFFIS